MTDKSQQWIWWINKEEPKKISQTTLGKFLKDINKGLTSVNTNARFAKHCFLTRMDFNKPYIFFCTNKDAMKWIARNYK